MGTKEWNEMRDGYIDSRDIIERLDELNAAADEDENGCTHCGEGSFPHPLFPSLCEDHGDELAILRSFAEQGEGCPDWPYGETFIPDDQFEDYARQLADDIGTVKDDGHWPTTYIDWERATDALKADYLSVEVDGTTYWGRA